MKSEMKKNPDGKPQIKTSSTLGSVRSFHGNRTIYTLSDLVIDDMLAIDTGKGR